jgi:NAD-dependent dihydropyrimidine dehydrogenase PreA subunit
MSMSDDLHGTFIEVEVDESIAGNGELASKLEEVCPVDIYSAEGGKVGLVRENLDECVLCELCLDAAPDGKLAVHKLYDGSKLVR